MASKHEQDAAEARLMEWYAECRRGLAVLYPALSADAIARVAERWIIADLAAAVQAAKAGQPATSVAAGTIDRMKAAVAAEVAR